MSIWPRAPTTTRSSQLPRTKTVGAIFSTRSQIALTLGPGIKRSPTNQYSSTPCSRLSRYIACRAVRLPCTSENTAIFFFTLSPFLSTILI